MENNAAMSTWIMQLTKTVPIIISHENELPTAKIDIGSTA